MESNNIIDKIKVASERGVINPSNGVWKRLEQRLDSKMVGSEIPVPKRHVINLKFMSVAAAVLVLVGLGTYLLFFPNQNANTLAVELEDLHTLEINTEFNAPMAGDATTLPSILFAEPLLTTYNHINEGAAGKKLVKRSQVKDGVLEYGLG